MHEKRFSTGRLDVSVYWFLVFLQNLKLIESFPVEWCISGTWDDKKQKFVPKNSGDNFSTPAGETSEARK